MTKFSGTLRDVIQNFNLAAIYDAKVSNSSFSLQKTPISDLNVDETDITFVKLSEKQPGTHFFFFFFSTKTGQHVHLKSNQLLL